MEFGNIAYQPIGGAVASFAVVPDSHLMDILMAGNAILLGLIKDQLLMTLTALRPGMLSFQWKAGGAVIVFEFGEINLPSAGIMTKLTVHLEIWTMRLGLLSGEIGDEQHHQHQEWQSIHWVFFVL